MLNAAWLVLLSLVCAEKFAVMRRNRLKRPMLFMSVVTFNDKDVFVVDCC